MAMKHLEVPINILMKILRNINERARQPNILNEILIKSVRISYEKCLMKYSLKVHMKQE